MFFLDALLKALKTQFDDDIVDRLNSYYTPMLMLIISLTLSAKQYVGQPIQCWIPAQFTGAWEQYSENYCFVQNTYFLPLHFYIPSDVQERENREIGYYQWVPFALGLQALLFYLPCLLWRLLNWQSGVSVKALVAMSQDVSNMHPDKRKESVAVVAAYVHDSLFVQRQINRGLCSVLYSRGTYLTSLYLFVKVLYAIQVVVQLFILNSFLGTQYTFWGFEILRDLFHGREWQESGHFPRVTMCDFDVRVLGNVHRHTVQCVLMINMFNEKVFLFIWWWLLIVAIATFSSLVYWVIMSLNRDQQRDFIAQYIRVHGLLNDASDRKTLNRFVTNSLRRDGVFILRIIAANAGDLITTDIVVELWKMFLEEQASAPPPPKLTAGSGVGSKLDDVDIGFHEYPNHEKQPLT